MILLLLMLIYEEKMMKGYLEATNTRDKISNELKCCFKSGANSCKFALSNMDFISRMY